jgi:hypothetical protein
MLSQNGDVSSEVFKLLVAAVVAAVLVWLLLSIVSSAPSFL